MIRVAWWLAGCACAVPAHASWMGSVDENGLRTATVTGEAHFGSARVPATLKLACRPGLDGTVAWELELAEASRIADFGFDHYEGPDARAAKERLTEIVPEGGMLRTTVRAAAAGYYGVTPDTFVLSVSTGANAASDVALLAELISAQTEAVQWTTRSLALDGAALVARFAADGAAPVVRETIMGCGPPPALDAKALERALGRNPAATNLFAQRGLEWRLEGLLGREHDAFLARVARAKPLARSGDVWFVLAAPGDGHGATAVMFDASGALEVVLADDGGTRRLATSLKPLVVPEPVREFLAQHATERRLGPLAPARHPGLLVEVAGGCRLRLPRSSTSFECVVVFAHRRPTPGTSTQQGG